MRREGRGIRVSLEHEGCSFSRMVSVQAGAVVTVEDQEAAGQAFRVRWYLAPECEVRIGDPEGTWSVVTVEREGKAWKARFRSLATPVARVRLDSATVSRYFGQTESCQVIEVISHGSLTTEWHRLTSS